MEKRERIKSKLVREKERRSKKLEPGIRGMEEVQTKVDSNPVYRVITLPH